jgi:hypothetical protein
MWRLPTNTKVVDQAECDDLRTSEDELYIYIAFLEQHENAHPLLHMGVGIA